MPQEPEDNILSPAEAELERALGALRPSDTAIDRGQLLFAAGLAAGRASESAAVPARFRWGWQLAAAAAASIAIATSLALILRPAPQPQVRIVYITAPQPTPKPAQATMPILRAEDSPARVAPQPPITPGSYLALRQLVLTRGIDALPVPKAAPSKPDPTVLQLMQQLGRG